MVAMNFFLLFQFQFSLYLNRLFVYYLLVILRFQYVKMDGYFEPWLQINQYVLSFILKKLTLIIGKGFIYTDSYVKIHMFSTIVIYFFLFTFIKIWWLLSDTHFFLNSYCTSSININKQRFTESKEWEQVKYDVQVYMDIFIKEMSEYTLKKK